MLNFNSLLLFSEDPKKLADFYQKVFENEPVWSDGNYFSFQAGDGFLTIGPHDKVNGKSPNPERIMLNFETEDVEKEFERIKSLRADVIADPYHPDEMAESTIATLADPDGNYFQLMTPMPEEMKQ